MNDKEHVIFVNGATTVKIFLQWYLEDECHMSKNEAEQYIDKKIEDGKIVVLLSSSGSNRTNMAKREEQWKEMFVTFQAHYRN